MTSHTHSSFSLIALLLLAASLLTILGCATSHPATVETTPATGVSSAATTASTASVDGAAASAWIDKGNEAIDQSHWSDAVAYFDSALRLDRRNPIALAGRAKATTMLNDGSSLDRTAQEIRLRREATLAEFDAAYLNTQDALRAHNFSSAKGMLLSATVQLDDNRQILSKVEHATRRTQADELLALIDEASELARTHRRGF